MRILLVRPPRMKQAITVGEFMFCEPIGLECLYSVLKHKHTIKILDMMVDKTDIVDECINWKPEVIGMTSLCIDVKNVLNIARQVKAYDEKIITMVGGSQTFVEPSAFHDNAIDHVMQYTSRQNLLELFSRLAKGRVNSPIDGIESRALGFKSTGVAGRNEYIVPDIECTAQYRKHYSYFGYRPCAIMQTSQGCGKQCRFCLRWRIEGGSEQPQELEVVFKQIQRINEPNIMIFDNDFLCNAARLNELCELLEKNEVKKNILCYGSVHSILKNQAAVKRLAKNGLRAVLVGYESFNSEEMKQYEKKSTVDDNLEASRFLKKIKVDAWASFMLHPDWKIEDFRKFRRYIRKLSPEISSMAPLTPFSILPLYKEYSNRLLIDRNEYEKWNFGEVSIMPSQMSLRRYYLEILLSNLYVNLFMNNTVYLVRKFGIVTLVRLLSGSIRLMKRYIVLMLRCGKIH